jgi:hypothetical protein
MRIRAVQSLLLPCVLLAAYSHPQEVAKSGTTGHVLTQALEFTFQVREPFVPVGFGQRAYGRWYPLISRLSRRTSRRDATPLLLVADSGKDLEEQLWANDPSQVEAWWASGRLEIRPGVAAKLQNGKSLVHEHARRGKTRQ